METRLIEKTEESIGKILDEGLNTNNLEHLYKLSKINHMAKEDKQMNYGNYMGRTPGYDSYGNYGESYARGSYGRDSYNARGRDMRYRGDESLDRVYNEYGRYQESRSRYGANNEDTDKSFHYMVKALEDFIMVLKEEAETPQQKQKLRESLQNLMR